MKKSLYILPVITLVLLTGTTFGQAKKYPLFEHFTQASCGPCASQNPFFQEVYYANESNVHHVAYHTSWPGYDPMYEFNSSESDAMVDYYGVTGVPDMIQNGVEIGSPAGVTQDIVNNLLAETSPIRVLVTESTTGTTRNVHIEVVTVGTVPAGTYKIKAAAVEHIIEYGSAPGTNGETEFPNVFRESITGTSGVTFTPAAIGGSVSFDYSYELVDDYIAENMYALAWVQESGSKNVLNSGSALDPDIEVINLSTNTFVQGVSGAATAFSGQVLNLSDAMGMNIDIDFAVTQPGDWSASYTYDGTTYTGATSAYVGASGDVPVGLNVNVGPTPAIGEYTITVSFPDNPELAPQVLSYYIISGVTDLVVNNEVSFGDGSPYGTYDWESLYTDGLASADLTTYAATSHFTMKKGFNSGALSEVENIYYNVGWTFPGLVSDAEKISQLMDFLDNGGNLFISGQDIGWEVNEYAAYYPEAVDFYENYLMASYVADAASGASTFTAVADDTWYGTVAESDISKPYGTDYYYPEQIEPNGVDAFSIFSYNAGTKIGGVRAETSDFKTVYLGIGLEMIADDAVRNAVMEATYLYFRGNIDGITYDQLIQGLLGGAQPNPAVNSTMIPMENIEQDMTLAVTDITGKVVYTGTVQAGTTAYTLSTTELGAGMYFYYLTNGAQRTQTEKLQIVK
ncbi:MAG TPA: Omp28-related outer membrane protein [Chitinophagales bacterium]|nr:Omp28-related outer membrane protein [Chitinophagales bacterium]